MTPFSGPRRIGHKFHNPSAGTVSIGDGQTEEGPAMGPSLFPGRVPSLAFKL